METFSALLAICAENSPVSGEFPAQRPVTRSFDVFLDLRLNKRLSKQSWGWWFETPSWSLWRHRNACMAWMYMIIVGSGNDLAPVRYQAINCTNGDSLSTVRSPTNFCKIGIKTQKFPLKKISSKCRQRNELVLAIGSWDKKNVKKMTHSWTWLFVTDTIKIFCQHIIWK